jgi:peroxiredoxin
MMVDGKAVSLSSYLGHPVWLTFGATSCVPCQAEAPDIEAAYKKFKNKGVIVLAIFIREDSAIVRDYSDRVGLTFPKVTDPDSRIASAYRVPDWTSDDAQGHHGFVTGFRAHFFIDRSGVLRSRQTGGLTPEQMGAALTEISRWRRDGCAPLGPELPAVTTIFVAEHGRSAADPARPRLDLVDVDRACLLGLRDRPVPRSRRAPARTRSENERCAEYWTKRATLGARRDRRARAATSPGAVCRA